MAVNDGLDATGNRVPLLSYFFVGHLGGEVLKFLVGHVGLRTFTVPREIHEEWKKGGVSRSRLVELFAKCGFDKDCVGWVFRIRFQLVYGNQDSVEMLINKQILWPLKEAFIGRVTLETKQKQSLTMKMTAKWMSEDKMRETFKE